MVAAGNRSVWRGAVGGLLGCVLAIGCGGAMGSGGGGTGGRGVAAGTGGTTVVDPATCASGMTWTGGNDGSEDMQPGAACIACHRTAGAEAPKLAVGGTVYGMLNEPTECYGVSGSAGIHVVITGADGAVVTLTPTASGNFSYQGTIALPLMAKVTDGNGGVRAMAGSQMTGDCNGCHTQVGTNLAPGRILVP